MMIGSVSMDPVLARDEMHRTMMERGSSRLAASIEATRLGRVIHYRPNLLWLTPYTCGTKDYGHEPQAPLSVTHRHPCAGCGVRADHHLVHGCSSYRRGVAA